MDFKKDIFISYAHIDNAVLGEGQKGWITFLHRALEVRLSQLLGERPVIWRDEKLQGNDYFGDEIVDQFPEVALLLSIITPRYIKSEWCTRELETFNEVAQTNIGGRVKNKSRVLKVIKTPVPIEEHPKSIRDILGYEFYNIEEGTRRTREFSQNPESGTAQQYWTKLDDLAHDIVDILNEIKKVPDSNAKGPASHVPPQQGAGEDEGALTIFLAETSSDVREQREALRREFQQHGHTILPNQNLPLIADELQESVGQMLQETDIAVHIIGRNYGIVPEETQKSVTVLQNETAAGTSKSHGLPRFLWMPPEIASEEPRQQQFIEQLRSDSSLQEGAELYEAPLEDLKYALHGKIGQIIASRKKQKEQQEENPETEGEDIPKQVYLICDQRDLDATIEIEDHLFNAGFDVILPAFEGDETQIRTDHQENLKLCDATLIFYGNANDLWMRSKTRDLMKIAGYGRKKPLKAKGVYLAPPESRMKSRFRSRDSIVVNGIAGFDPKLMETFVEKLQDGQ